MVEAGRGQLIRVKPGGVALKSSAEVAKGVIHVKVEQRDGCCKSDIAVGLYYYILEGYEESEC